MGMRGIVRRALESLLALCVLAFSAHPAAAQTQHDFFDDRSLQDVRLTIGERDWSALQAHFACR